MLGGDLPAIDHGHGVGHVRKRLGNLRRRDDHRLRDGADLQGEIHVERCSARGESHLSDVGAEAVGGDVELRSRPRRSGAARTCRRPRSVERGDDLGAVRHDDDRRRRAPRPSGSSTRPCSTPADTARRRERETGSGTAEEKDEADAGQWPPRRVSRRAPAGVLAAG